MVSTFNIGKKLKEVEKELGRGKIIQRSIEKRKRKNKKRLKDFKSSEQGRKNVRIKAPKKNKS